MKKLLTTLLIFCSSCSLLLAQKSNIQYTQSAIPCQSPVTNPLHETRAVWLTTIGGIDWPHSYAHTSWQIPRQQQELCDILDRLAAANINTILLQTRIRATTIFPSAMEPWDGCLSGQPGSSPGYDALAYAISECHKRGMKLHAWVVTIPVGKWNGAGCRNLRNTSPNLLKKIGDEGFMNPEAEGTADYLARFCADLTKRYDLDGIHLDYIRYPDTWGAIKNKVQARENITRIVRKVHHAVKSIKPWTQLSCSPVGKYADTRRQWSHGWNARDIVCQDVALWMQEGLMDAIYPMMYFKNENFYPFAIDWQERSTGKIVAPGLGIYFMHPREKNWSLMDITRELHALRQYGMGNCMFRSKFFTDNTKGIYDYYKLSFASLPSLQPAMTWLSNSTPARPYGLQVSQQSNGISLSWEYAADKEVTYNLYGSDSYPVDITTADNLLAASLQSKSIELGKTGSLIYFAITATDRYGNESAPLQMNGDDDSSTSAPQTTDLFLPCDNRIVLLPSNTVSSGTLLTISNLVGNEVTSCIARSKASDITINVASLTPGHYVIHSLNEKGIRHLIGRFSIPIM